MTTKVSIIKDRLLKIVGAYQYSGDKEGLGKLLFTWRDCVMRHSDIALPSAQMFILKEFLEMFEELEKQENDRLQRMRIAGFKGSLKGDLYL